MSYFDQDLSGRWACQVCTLVNESFHFHCVLCNVGQNPFSSYQRIDISNTSRRTPSPPPNIWSESTISYPVDANDDFLGMDLDQEEMEDIDMLQVSRCMQQFQQHQCAPFVPPLSSQFDRARSIGVHGSPHALETFEEYCIPSQRQAEIKKWRNDRNKAFTPTILQNMGETCSTVVLLGHKDTPSSSEQRIAHEIETFVGNGGVVIFDKSAFYVPGTPMRQFIKHAKMCDVDRYPCFANKGHVIDIWRFGGGCVIWCQTDASQTWRDIVDFSLSFCVLSPLADSFNVLKEFLIKELVPEVLEFAFDLKSEECRMVVDQYSFFGSFCSLLHLE